MAKVLGLSLEPLGNITVQCFAGRVKQDTFKTKARIKTKKGISELECLVSKCKQELALFKYDIPSEWARKYNIKRVTSSPHGTNLMIIGKDNCHLFPEVLCTEVGLQLSKSKLSGLPIVSGRAMSKEDPLLSQNTSVITHAFVMNKSVSMDIDPILMSDRINESPLKRCLKCKNCISCKSEKKPDEVRQEKHKEIIKESIQFDPVEGYSVTYAKNGLLPTLPDNSDNVKRRMKSLEAKLIKNEFDRSI